MAEHLSRDEYLARVRERAINCAREILAGRLGIVAGSRLLAEHLSELEHPELEEVTRILAGVNSETDHFPLGAVRDLWSPSALAAMDAQLREAEVEDGVLVADTCRQVLAVLERAV